MFLQAVERRLSTAFVPTRKLTALIAGLLLLSVQTASAAVTEGTTAPDCKLTTIDGSSPATLSEHKGKVVLVDFWASWCGPCGQSFPFLNDLHAQLKDMGLQIVGVNVDEHVEDASAFLANHPASFIVMRDANMQCVNDFGVEAMPSSFLIDRQGVVHHIHKGFRAGESKELRSLVEKAVSEK